MTNPADSSVQNLLPVQAYFDAQNNFVTFIGQNKPFTAIIDPDQSGLHITNSTIDSSVIGGTTPAAGTFTSFATTTGTISTQASGATDIVNLLALQSYAAGISWKQPCACATLTSITLSGLQTIDGHLTLDGDRVLVKDQGTASQNGIYIAKAGAWTRALDADTWDELICAISFIEYGTQAGGAWFCTAQPGGTLGVTAVNWSQFTTSATYTAGTGLTLTGFEFKITNTGVAASTYGSATASPVFAVNAQGQITSVTNTTITPAIGNVTGLATGMLTFLQTPTSANLAATVSDETGTGSLVFATSPTLVTPALGTPASGDFSSGTFTWPTFNQNTTGTASKATNIVGGAAGSVPYQSAADTTTFLAAGTNGQVLTLASGVPSWATPTTGTVTSVSGTGTVNGLTLTGTVTSSGSLTLGGTLDLSSPPAIGGTAANSGAFTTVTASTSLTTPTVQATNSAGLALKNSAGTTQMSMGAGGGDNLAINVSANLNGTNAQIDISPTGTGHVHINPTGSGSIEMNPTSAGVMNNMVIGGTTPLAGTFTTLRVNSTISLAGSTGTSGYVLTSNGASAPTWAALPASGITITDNTSSSSTYYPAITTATSGSITGATTSSTKFSFVPNTGRLTVNGSVLVGNGGSDEYVYFDSTIAYVGRKASTGDIWLNCAGAQNTVFGIGGTQAMTLTGNGALSFGSSGTNYGAAGQALFSNGNAAPSWTTAVGPAFNATLSTNQSITGGVYTKVSFNTASINLGSNYDASTNYRFTPTVAGYYYVSIQIGFGGNNTGQGNTMIYKNGSEVCRALCVGSGFGYNETPSKLIQFNGSTDYVEAYVQTTTNETILNGTYSQFQAYFVRA
jgi:hypothetical protein